MVFEDNWIVRLALQLFGKPVLTVAGVAAKAGPRKNLQLLVLLNLAPGQRRHRDKLCELLWADELADRRREHLRPVVSRLKAALTELGYPDLLVSDGPMLGLSQPIPMDLDGVLDGSADVAVEQFQVVMAGWDDAVVSEARARVQSALSKNLERLVRTNTDQESYLELLQGFLATYPHCVRATALCYKLVKERGEADVASALIQNFETAWLEDEGPVDLPDIEQEAERLDLTPLAASTAIGDSGPGPASLRTKLNFLSLIGALIVSSLAVADIFRPRPFVRAHPWELHGWGRPTNTGNYNAYVFCPDGVTWYEASAFAKALGCRLATVKSKSQNVQILSGATEAFAADDTFPGWIGARSEGGRWVWEDGSPVAMTSWDANPFTPKGNDSGCVAYHIVRETTDPPWAALPCDDLADGFFLESMPRKPGKEPKPPDQDRTLSMVAHWHLKGEAP